ncbi:hypothetical protein GCM10027299_21400 [Larkinella ripae]
MNDHAKYPLLNHPVDTKPVFQASNVRTEGDELKFDLSPISIKPKSVTAHVQVSEEWPISPA